jgi:hypothetical protein
MVFILEHDSLEMRLGLGKIFRISWDWRHGSSLPSKHEALSSNSNKQNNKTNNKTKLSLSSSRL